MRLDTIVYLALQLAAQQRPIVTEIASGRCIIIMQNVYVGGKFTVNCEGIGPGALKRLNEELVQSRLEKKQALKKAEEFAEKYDDLEKLLATIKINPGNRQQYMMADQYLHDGQLEKARETFKKLLDLDRENMAADNYAMALTYALEFKPQDEVPYLEEAYRLRPDESKYAEEYARVLIAENSYKEAEKVSAKNLQKLQKSVRSDSPSEERQALAGTLHNLAMIYWHTDRPQDAESSMSKAAEIYAALAKDDPYYRVVLAGAQNNLGVYYKTQGKLEDARNAFQMALDAYSALAIKDPDRYLGEKAMVLGNLGSLDSSIGDIGQAEEDYKESVRLYNQLIEKNRTVYLAELPPSLDALGILYRAKGNRAKAKENLEKAAQIVRQVAKENPGAYSPDLVMILNDLALFYSDEKETFAQAEKVYSEAMNTARELAKEQPDAFEWVFAEIAHNVGMFYSDNSEFKKANDAYQEALPIFQKLAKDNSVGSLDKLGAILNDLALLAYKQKLLRESLEYTNKTLDVARHLLLANPIRYGRLLTDASFRKIDILKKLDAGCQEIVAAADEIDRVSPDESLKQQAEAIITACPQPK